jgi:hypothetical protein
LTQIYFSTVAFSFSAGVWFLKFNNTYPIRMAGMFMIVLGTIWVRTGLMPRLLAIITYLTAISLIIGVVFWPWSTLFFPVWIFLISVYILVLNSRFNQEQNSVTFGG